ncbi:diguanylate cyclase [Lysobacter sp. A3-1-A15]
MNWQEVQTRAALDALFVLLLGLAAAKVGLALAGVWPVQRPLAVHAGALAVACAALWLSRRSRNLTTEAASALVYVAAVMTVISTPGVRWADEGVVSLGGAWLLPPIGIPLLARLGSALTLAALCVLGVTAYLVLSPPDPVASWAVALYLAIGIGAGLLLRRLRSDMTIRYRRMVEEATRQSRMDPLTGLHNRRGWQVHASDVLRRCYEMRTPVALVFLDLDHFKQLNDTHGHVVGDRVLGLVGRVLEARIADGVAARLGGEEFACVLPGAGAPQALAFTRHVRGDLAQGSPAVSFSGGLVVARRGDSLADLMTAADNAMYRAKDGGRDRVVVTDRSGGD